MFKRRNIYPPSNVIERREFLYPAATPLLVKARGGLAIAMKKMFARNKELRGGVAALYENSLLSRVQVALRQEEGRLLRLGTAEQNFIPIRDEYKERISNIFIYI